MVSLTRRSEDSIDPLSRVLSPPAKESAEQRAQREAKEAEARQINDRIDEQIKSERQANSRNKKGPVKVVMLGQAESGAPPPSTPLISSRELMRSLFRTRYIQASRRR
jgi:hypothetical protein